MLGVLAVEQNVEVAVAVVIRRVVEHILFAKAIERDRRECVGPGPSDIDHIVAGIKDQLVLAIAIKVGGLDDPGEGIFPDPAKVTDRKIGILNGLRPGLENDAVPKAEVPECDLGLGIIVELPRNDRIIENGLVWAVGGVVPLGITEQDPRDLVCIVVQQQVAMPVVVEIADAVQLGVRISWELYPQIASPQRKLRVDLPLCQTCGGR